MQLFIQMSGAPGAGKTTVARAVAKHIGAVVVDHDVTKTALLDADIPAAGAGYASYMVLHAVARHVLEQGFSVVFDSPCFYSDLLERGRQLAKQAGVAYRYIECRIDDLDELDRRLRTRARSRSQLAGVYAEPTEGSGKAATGEQVFREWIANMQRPAGEYLVLDTARPIEECVREALAYIATGRAADQLRLEVCVAEAGDIPAWLDLAAGVEDLFGPMVDDPAFRRALEHNIECRTAFCIREAGGPPGTPLVGATLFSPRHAPQYRVGWLAVAEAWRRHGAGRALMEHVFRLIAPPAELTLRTFGADIAAGVAARRFYERLGFVAAEAAPTGPDGGSRQVFRRVFR